MKFCANLTLLYAELPFLERFKQAAQDGFSAVEIQFPYDYSIADIKAELDKNQLTLVLINIAAGDLMQGGEGLACVPERMNEFDQALQQCASYVEALGVSHVNVLAGRCYEPSRQAEYVDCFLHNLDKAADCLAPLGVTTTFEAINTLDMPSFLISTTAQTLWVLEQTNNRSVRAQFDLYHMAKMQQDMAGFIQNHSDKIGHIQFADTPNRGEPGTGNMDFEKWFGLIEQSGYQGYVGAEYRPTKATNDTLAWLK
ncbi:MAG: TIM barrel protein [Venatoribacter sp.]